MKDVYRVRIRGPRRMRLGWLLLVLGMLCLYGASILEVPSGMTVEPSAGVTVTREETLGEQEFFLVSLYSSTDAEICRAEAARFVSRGASGTVVYTGGLYHAIGAAFDDGESAAASAHALSETENIDARSVSLCAPEVLLHITATKTQLAALLRADAVLLEAIAECGDIAAVIDAGEVDLQGAQGRLSAQASRLDAAQQELSTCVSGGKEPVSEALLQLLSNAQKEAARLAGLSAPARLQLSSCVRCLQIDLLSAFCAYRNNLVR